MKTERIIQPISQIGFEKIQQCRYVRGNKQLVIDTVSIANKKTVEIKSFFDGSALIKTLFVVFDKAGKRIEKYIR